MSAQVRRAIIEGVQPAAPHHHRGRGEPALTPKATSEPEFAGPPGSDAVVGTPPREMTEAEQLRVALWTLARQAQEYRAGAELLHGLRDRAAEALRKFGWNDVEIYGTGGNELYELVILKADEAFFGAARHVDPPPAEIAR